MMLVMYVYENCCECMELLDDEFDDGVCVISGFLCTRSFPMYSCQTLRERDIERERERERERAKQAPEIKIRLGDP